MHLKFQQFEQSFQLTFLVATLSLDFRAFAIPRVLAVPFATGQRGAVVFRSYNIKQQHSLEATLKIQFYHLCHQVQKRGIA